MEYQEKSRKESLKLYRENIKLVFVDKFRGKSME